MGFRLDLHQMMAVSAALRLGLMAYGEWQDAHMEVRYTDVDYFVFSDAAALVAAGRSPFGRSTYRYSPLLAFLLVPNSVLHHAWGKLLFSAADLLVGNVLQAAFWYGLIVHFRIYPIIYSLPILVVLNEHKHLYGWKPSVKELSAGQHTLQTSRARKTGSPTLILRLISDPWLLFRSMLTRDRILFGLFSGAVFFAWTIFFFYLYGWEFLNEALLYHLTRTDPRHNFSIYFYHIYLHHQYGFSLLEKLFSFLPQLMVQVVLIVRFSQDLPFCFFVQTVAFVAFNKVVTAQYFVWFFCLLPLILPWSSIQLKGEGLTCILGWMGAQIHWLMWGYLLEFKGKNVFVQLWLASIMFLAANTYVLVIIIRSHRFSPVFVSLGNENSSDARKTK